LVPILQYRIEGLEEVLDDVRARGASLVAISQQTPPNSQKAKRDNGLSFPILSDRGGEVGAAFGLLGVVPKDMQEVHKRLGGPLPSFNDEDCWTLPMYARYVIGQDGIIAYGEVNPDYTRRPEPSELFPILDRLKTAAAA
jgi:peroxiredoxin